MNSEIERALNNVVYEITGLYDEGKINLTSANYLIKKAVLSVHYSDGKEEDVYSYITDRCGRCLKKVPELYDINKNPHLDSFDKLMLFSRKYDNLGLITPYICKDCYQCLIQKIEPNKMLIKKV